jgi:enamine deaminase RidA (YjgF/YER057c/UK114 family)
LIFVSGLTARGPQGDVVALGDAAAQTRQVLTNLSAILEDVGATLDDVVRTTTYLRNMDDHSVVHAVRREFFGETPPTSTTIEVSRLFDPAQLVEIEAIASIEPTPE